MTAERKSTADLRQLVFGFEQEVRLLAGMGKYRRLRLTMVAADWSRLRDSNFEGSLRR